jgi:ribosomal protein S13
MEEKRKGVKRRIELNTRKGIRYLLSFPVRGQRTRSNAKTAKLLNKKNAL